MLKKRKRRPKKDTVCFLFYADNIPLSGDLIFSSITLVLKIFHKKYQTSTLKQKALSKIYALAQPHDNLAVVENGQSSI